MNGKGGYVKTCSPLKTAIIAKNNRYQGVDNPMIAVVLIFMRD